jgi:hypothetical protein
MITTTKCVLCGTDITTQSKADNSTAVNSHLRTSHPSEWVIITERKNEFDTLSKRRKEIRDNLKKDFGYTLFGY